MAGPTWSSRRWVAALLFSLLLLTAGVLAVDGSDPLQLKEPPFRLPWAALVPLYLLATHYSLGFQRRESSVAVTLVQLPLALGVVLVAPWAHLLARLLAAAGMSAARRHDPLKVVFNLGVAALEVGLAALTLSLLREVDGPEPMLWAGLLLGLLLGEAASQLALLTLFRLLGLPVTRREVAETAGVGLVTSVTATALAILTLSATWTEPWILVVVLGLAAGLLVSYRAHRRLVAQQRTTEDLYTFVKDLGPVDVEQPDALQALERVRELLHAEHLELVAVDASGGMGRSLAVHLAGEPENRPRRTGAPSLDGPDLRADCMTTPLFAGGGVVGLLTARHRIGSDRPFDMRDLRLLETLAAELATALDRGRMLRDLGRAATTDSLTGLRNLSATTRSLDEMIARAGQVLVAAVAVDSFREVNDTLGHQVGDDLLREVALRLQEFAGEAVLGRLGGGRFAIALPSTGRAEDRAMYGLQLRTQVEGEAQVGVIGTHVRLSVGCARFPEDGTDSPTLLRRAQTAMHSARQAHGGPVLWEPAYEVQGQRRLAVVMALREALSTGAIGIAYQPKVAAADGRCTGVEALARWTHPALGRIGPDEFIPLAEASGLMGQLTTTVLQQALTACRTWQAHGEPVGVAVNVSADTLQDPRFVTEVATTLEQTGVAPWLLTLELTENVVVADPQVAAERMQELRALGVRLSVDDFGTGYSSLTYLKGLPIDEVKIDKGFVAGLAQEPGDQAVVRAVVDIAHTLQISVVAEGVEQEDQHVLLGRLGVDQVQGYLHARPMPAAEIDTWLSRRGALPAGGARPWLDARPGARDADAAPSAVTRPRAR